MSLRKLLNIYPTNLDKINAIKKGEFTHADMHEFLDVFYTLEDASINDTSNRSPLEVVLVGFTLKNKTLNSVINDIAPYLLKYDKSLHILSQLSNDGKIKPALQMLLLKKLMKNDKRFIAITDIHQSNLNPFINICIEELKQEKTLSSVANKMSIFKSYFFCEYQESFNKALKKRKSTRNKSKRD